MKYFPLMISGMLLLTSCEGVNEIINPYKAPVISDEGIVFNRTMPVSPAETLLVSVSADNPESGPLTYSWTAPDGGSFYVATDQNEATWIAPLKGGNYTIKVDVYNDKKSSTSRDAQVLSPSEPFVQILTPAENESVVQGGQITVTARAYHDNGLKQVRLDVNGLAYGNPLDYNSSDEYVFTFTATQDYLGVTELKVVAQSPLQVEGSDKVKIKVQGIVFGKQQRAH